MYSLMRVANIDHSCCACAAFAMVAQSMYFAFKNRKYGIEALLGVTGHSRTIYGSGKNNNSLNNNNNNNNNNDNNNNNYSNNSSRANNSSAYLTTITTISRPRTHEDTLVWNHSVHGLRVLALCLSAIGSVIASQLSFYSFGPLEPFLYISTGQALYYTLTRLISDLIDGVIDLQEHYSVLAKAIYSGTTCITALITFYFSHSPLLTLFYFYCAGSFVHASLECAGSFGYEYSQLIYVATSIRHYRAAAPVADSVSVTPASYSPTAATAAAAASAVASTKSSLSVAGDRSGLLSKKSSMEDFDEEDEVNLQDAVAKSTAPFSSSASVTGQFLFFFFFALFFFFLHPLFPSFPLTPFLLPSLPFLPSPFLQFHYSLYSSFSVLTPHLHNRRHSTIKPVLKATQRLTCSQRSHTNTQQVSSSHCQAAQGCAAPSAIGLSDNNTNAAVTRTHAVGNSVFPAVECDLHVECECKPYSCRNTDSLAVCGDKAACAGVGPALVSLCHHACARPAATPHFLSRHWSDCCHVCRILLLHPTEAAPLCPLPVGPHVRPSSLLRRTLLRKMEAAQAEKEIAWHSD